MKEEKSGAISRREFLRNAGFAVGGATVGSMAFLNACKSTSTGQPKQRPKQFREPVLHHSDSTSYNRPPSRQNMGKLLKPL